MIKQDTFAISDRWPGVTPPHVAYKHHIDMYTESYTH